MAGSVVMAFFAHSPAAYYFCYACLFSVMQICGSGVASQVLVARWFNRRRAAALAILLSAGGVAGLIFPPLTARLVEMAGTWRSIWWVVWGCCAAAFLFAVVFGLFFSFTMMGPMTQVMNYFGVAYYSQIIGVQNMVSTFAKSLTNLAAGQCWDLTGSYGPFFLAIGAACVLGSAWNRFARVPTPPGAQG